MLYEIADREVQNLKSFLDRVQLDGKEVPAFVRVLNSFVPIQEKPKPVVKPVAKKEKKPEVVEQAPQNQ